MFKLRWVKNGGAGSFSVWIGKATTIFELNQLKMNHEEEMEAFYPGGCWFLSKTS